ncbi:MAG: hypothetical protein ACRD0E_07385, partial [Acidimicrobiales bacterium]
SYAGQVGKRIPVPLFQSFECLVIFSVVIWIERRIRGRGLPVGFVLAAGVTLWDIARFADEFFWLAVPRLWDAVEVASVVFAVIGLAAMAIMWTRSQSGRATTGPAPAGSMAAGSMAVGSMTAGSIGAESGAGPGPGAGLGRPSVLSAALPGEPGSGTGLVPGDRQTPGL